MRNVSILATASIAALCLASLAACGDGVTERNTSGAGAGSTGGSSTGGSGTGAGGMTSTGGSGSGGNACPAPAPAHPNVIDAVGDVTALVQDLNNAAAANITADVCGTNLCLFAETDAQGNLNVQGNNTDLNDVRLLYGDGHDFVKMGAELPSVPTAAFNTINAVRLPATGAQMPCLPAATKSDCVAAAGTFTHGDVTFEIGADTVVDYDGILYVSDAEKDFRTVTFQGSDGVMPALDPSLNLAVYFGTAPINTEFCPPAKMTVPNSEAWTAGAAVEFYLHGTLTFSHWAPYGGWAKISDGVVSSDGLTVSTNDGDGIPVLGLIGVRLAP
jgi:hypothetical protein